MTITNLSKNFTLEELTRTTSGLANIPTDAEVARLTDLVTKVLQPVRDILGKPIKINSGFRSLAVNNEVLRMKKVNGKSTYVAM